MRADRGQKWTNRPREGQTGRQMDGLMKLSRFCLGNLSRTIKKFLPTSENSICQTACAHSSLRVSKWTLLSLAVDLKAFLAGDAASFWAWSINHPLLKLQSVGRFQLRMRLVRDTVGGLMWGLYFCSQPQQTGEPQTSTSLINNECQGERRWTVDPRVSLWAHSQTSQALCHCLLQGNWHN